MIQSCGIEFNRITLYGHTNTKGFPTTRLIDIGPISLRLEEEIEQFSSIFISSNHI